MGSAAIPFKGKRQTGELPIVADYPKQDSSLDNADMPPRSQDEKVDKLLDLLLAQALAKENGKENGNGKQPKTLIFSIWFAPLVFVLSLGYSVVTRDTNQQNSIGNVDRDIKRVEAYYQQENQKLWSMIETQRLQIDNFGKEIAVLKDRLQRK